MASSADQLPSQQLLDGPSTKSAGNSKYSTLGYSILSVDRIAKREAKRLDKEAKLAAKVAKQSPTTPKVKNGPIGKKDKLKEEEQEFVNTTLPGEKKGTLCVV